jgi:hypothetical protein
MISKRKSVMRRRSFEITETRENCAEIPFLCSLLRGIEDSLPQPSDDLIESVVRIEQRSISTPSTGRMPLVDAIEVGMID